MGLYKICKCTEKRCQHPYWMSYQYQGRQIRESSESSDKAISKQILNKKKNDILLNKWFPERREEHTFIEAVEEYKKHHVSKLRSKNSYESYINNLMVYFSNHTLSQITPKEIYAYKSSRNGVSNSTRNRDIACLSGIFTFINNPPYEWTMVNPCSRVKREVEDNKRDRWLSLDEESRLLEAITVDYLKDIVEVAIDTGMRLNEILSLKLNQVNLKGYFITVRTFKTGTLGLSKLRSIPLTKRAFTIIEKRIKVQNLINQTDFIFTNSLGKPVTSLRAPFESAVKRAKLDDIHFHDLRHTCATRLAQSGLSLYIIQCILGHSDSNTTQRYAHHSVQSLRVASDKLDSLFLDNLKEIALTGIEKEVKND